MKKIVTTEKAPKAIGSYSQGTIYNGIVYTSGQISIDPDTQQFIDGDIEIQTNLVLKNLREILLAANSSLENVLKVTIFLKDMNDFVAVNQVYSKYFTTNPSRSTVEVKRLPKDALIEIECIAYIND